MERTLPGCCAQLNDALRRNREFGVTLRLVVLGLNTVGLAEDRDISSFTSAPL